MLVNIERKLKEKEIPKVKSMGEPERKFLK